MSASCGDLEMFRGRRAVLLDLDGTLYGNRANHSYIEAVDRVTGTLVRERYGLADPAEAFRRLEADQARARLGSKTETVTRLFGITLPEQNRWRERWTRPEDFLVGDERLLQVLERLASRYRLVLGTNNAPLLTRRILATLGVAESLFQAILTSEDVGAPKPDEQFFLAVLRVLQLPATDLVSVGDRPESDLVPAARLGMGTWLVREMEDVYVLEQARP